MRKSRISKIIAALLGAVLWCVWSGCSGEESPITPEFNYGEKDSIILSVDFRVSGAKSLPVEMSGGAHGLPEGVRMLHGKSRMVQRGNMELSGTGSRSGVNDRLVEDVNIYVVDGSGKVVHQGHYTSVAEMGFEAYDNMEYTVYAIANAGRRIPAGNLDELMGIEHVIDDISEMKSGSGAVLMGGASEPMQLKGKGTVTVYLTRCVSKINLKADYSELYDDVEISVNKVQLRNAPAVMKIFAENRISSSANAINGEIVYQPSDEDLTRGIEFWQFENLQGTLQPENTSQQQKQWPQGSKYAGICSYVELQASYSSPRKVGEILYRFYLGKDMVGNYDIARNTQMDITVHFTKDGAVDENTWRVDNSELQDLVTEIYLLPDNLSFTELGETKTIAATVYPASAYNKALAWSTSNPRVAEVDGYGNVTSVGNGDCTVTASSTDGSDVTASCSISVSEPEPGPEPEPDPQPKPDPEPEPQPQPQPGAKVEFQEKSLNMYDGQKYTLKFVAAAADASKLTATSSNPSVVKVTGVTATGVELEALAAGSATISAGTGGTVETTCAVTVEKLRIVPAFNEIEMYNHFYEDIEYTIYPTWAAGDFTIQMESSGSVVCGYEGIAERVIPQYSSGTTLPASGTITMKLQGKEDVTAQVNYTVKPMLAMVENIKVNANMGNTDAVRDLGLDMHPRADVQFSWTPADGRKYYGTPASGDVAISAEEGKIIFPIPNSSNGLYQLVATVEGDDGYGASGESDARKYCDITIYETVYLVGISKTLGREKVAGTQHSWKYENEIVAKWLSHPNSLMYPQGNVALDLPFSYKGVTYTESHTGVTESFEFTFEIGQQLDMALDSESATYNGTAPKYYLEYFRLEPAGSAYIEGNPATGEPYLYIYSRNFASGFSNSASPDWEKIFEIVYP